PTIVSGETRVRRVREGFELFFVAVLTCLAADIVIGNEPRDFSRAEFRRLGRPVVGEPTYRAENQHTDQECFDRSFHHCCPSLSFRELTLGREMPAHSTFYPQHWL